LGSYTRGILMSITFERRRNNMLDVIIVLVTMVMFVIFIGFTEGCERL
jgi:hypothetical protein